MPWGLTRFHHSGQSHFVTFCCYHRRRLFTMDAGRRTFESALERVRRSFRLHVYGYVVMPEHVHLLLSEPEKDTLADALKSLKQGVARRLIGAMRSISGKSGTTISTFEIIRSLWRNCATFIAIRGPQRARFWLAGVEAGEGWVMRTSGGLGVEQFSRLRNRR